MTLARELHSLTVGAGRTPDKWLGVGVEVREARLRDLHGYSTERDGRRRVLVPSADPTRRRRFTVAHEVGHLLLNEFHMREHFPVTYTAEEDLCDEFAAEMLMPVAVAEGLLAGQSPTPGNILATTRTFGVSFAVSLRQLSWWLSAHNSVAFITSWKETPDATARLAAYRVKCGDYFVPEGQTLRKRGLVTVECWASAASPTDCFAENVDEVRLKLWRPGQAPSSGVATGPCRVEAQALNGGLVLVVIDVSRMDKQWSSGRGQHHRPGEAPPAVGAGVP
jgi:hypothetical protein